MRQLSEVPEPWNGLFVDLDSRLNVPVALHCIGGFVITARYGLSRQTNDVDVVSITPRNQIQVVLALAGQGSSLHKRHGVYVQHVGIVTMPEDYEGRLKELCPGAYRNIRLYAPDPYDLALSKMDRNRQRDRDDVKHLAKTAKLDLTTLEERYEREVRPNHVGGPVERLDSTLRLWKAMLRE